ncbi:hypothetical protein MRB53_021055 [Persea americana]|uniref:Uncharacterized protein n=1 Tax=Persea americana TaxID=3435 RepID=A0ACC2L3Y9_PERAE|nr:hypothetical protein MRB53_021055 [Persea americana]
MVKDFGDEGTTATMMKPAWLQGLIDETFFSGCGVHENRRKNEKNIFCLNCCTSICAHCLPSHHSHPLLQVRRYVYHDVVRLDDLEKLIDCSYVQPYTINGAKVAFLNQRPQARPLKGSANNCLTCDRSLQGHYQFCCLSCKVDHVLLQWEDLSSILYKFDESDFAISQFEGLRMDSSDLIDDEDQITPSSILEDPLHFKGSSCSNNNSSSFNDSEESEVKIRKGSGFLPKMVLSSLSRRKGAPHRSPLS